MITKRTKKIELELSKPSSFIVTYDDMRVVIMRLSFVSMYAPLSMLCFVL